MGGDILMIVSSFLLILTLQHSSADPEVTFESFECHQTHFNATFTVDTHETNLYRRNMTATLKDANCLYFENNTQASYAADSNFTLHISMEFSEGCGTTYTDNENHIFSNQTILLRVTDTLRNGFAQRDFYYSYEVSCIMENRNFSIELTSTNYTVDKTVVVTKNESVTDAFDMGMTMKFYSDHTFGTEKTGTVTVGITEMLFVEIAPIGTLAKFNFFVDSCEAIDQLPYSSATVKDTFFKDKCPLDPTYTSLLETRNAYRFKFQAFYFSSASTNDVYLRCQLYVCHQNDTDAACTQTCSSSRKRRDAASDDIIEPRQITLVSPKITLETDKTCSDVTCGPNSECKELQPAVCICDDGFVFSRLQKKCTKERITQIDKIHLDQEWNPEYLDTNSDAFHRLAFKYEEILYKSFRAAGTDHLIEGVRVIKASKGSVILEVAIIHAVESSPLESYNYFVESIKAKARIATTVRKDLKMLTDTTPEIVTVQEKMVDVERLTMIIIIIVVLLLFLLTGITIIIARKRRSRVTKTHGFVTGFDNRGVVMERCN